MRANHWILAAAAAALATFQLTGPVLAQQAPATTTTPQTTTPQTTPPATATTPQSTTPPATPPATTTPPATPPAAAAPSDNSTPALPPPTPPDANGAGTPDAGTGDANAPTDGEDNFSLGDVPQIEVVELTPDMARRALDAYVMVRDKYKDADLENYESIQEFVDKNEQGKAFEADIKAAGFANVTDWDTAVATLGFAYSNALQDQTADMKQQIEELKADTEMAQDMRDRMIAALTAMIPSENNKKIVDDLMKDPVYGEKIKLLETEDE